MTRTARLVRIALVASCFAPAAAAGPPPASDRAPASAGPTASDRAPTWTWRTLTLLADGCRVRTPPRTDGAHDVLRLTFETTGGISKDGPFRVRSVGAALYRGFEDVEADQNALERVDPWSRNEHRATSSSSRPARRPAWTSRSTPRPRWPSPARATPPTPPNPQASPG